MLHSLSSFPSLSSSLHPFIPPSFPSSSPFLPPPFFLSHPPSLTHMLYTIHSVFSSQAFGNVRFPVNQLCQCPLHPVLLCLWKTVMLMSRPGFSRGCFSHLFCVLRLSCFPLGQGSVLLFSLQTTLSPSDQSPCSSSRCHSSATRHQDHSKMYFA